MPRHPLDRLRDALVRTSQIGKLKLDAVFLRRERDRLIQRLGEAALTLVETGDIAEHPGLADALVDIRALDQKLNETLRGISAIQRELEDSDLG